MFYVSKLPLYVAYDDDSIGWLTINFVSVSRDFYVSANEGCYTSRHARDSTVMKINLENVFLVFLRLFVNGVLCYNEN